MKVRLQRQDVSLLLPCTQTRRSNIFAYEFGSYSALLFQLEILEIAISRQTLDVTKKVCSAQVDL